MKKNLFPILLFVACNIAFSQKHDYTWIVGYAGSDSLVSFNTNFGTTYLDFNDSPVKVYKKWIKMEYNEANTTLSDENGNMLLTTNIVQARGKNGKYVKNGDTLLYNKGWYKYGIRAPQGILSLPIPNRKNQYQLIYGQRLISDFFPIYTSIFDKTIGTNGGIIDKNKIIINDTVAIGKISATKHGNGRDWWVHIANNGYKHYLLLLEPSGIKLNHIQKIGNNIQDGVGQTVFSPDGKRFVECNSVNNIIGQDIIIYNFDRCNGMLNSPYRIHFDTLGWSGIAISPNSRFLYFTEGWHVIQYDLQAADIKASETILATWDGFQDSGPTGFYLMQLGPDNKIYICTSAATSYMHVIDNPDEKGLACNVRQRGIKLPTYNSRSIPNNPNYRLGALKGSPCDTLNSVAVEDVETNNFDVLIMPNPSNDYVSISWQKINEQSVEISIRNMLGSEVQRTITNENNFIVNTADYPTGTYTISIISKDLSLKNISKLIINH